MRVLLIHQAFCGPDDPGATRHYEIAKQLQRDGIAFTVVTAPVSYLTGKEQRSPLEEVDVLYAGTLGALHRSFVQRLMVFTSFTVSAVIVGARVHEVDVVLGTSPPLPQALSAWALAKLKRVPFVLEIRDLWPDFAIEMGLLRSRFAIRAARALERFLYHEAARVVVNSPAYREHLLQKGVPEEKISVIPNGVDAAMFDPRDTGEHFRRTHGLEGKTVVLYAGAVGAANNVETILRAAAILKAQPDLAFLIVGDGKELPRLQEMAEQLGLANLRFLGAIAKNCMPVAIAAADICVACLRDLPGFRKTYPNKVFDYMAAGRPTVLAIDGVIREVIEASAGGIFVPPGNAEAMASAVHELHQNPQLRVQMGTRARAYVQRYFRRESQADDFGRVLREVVSPRRTELTTLSRVT